MYRFFDNVKERGESYSTIQTDKNVEGNTMILANSNKLQQNGNYNILKKQE